MACPNIVELIQQTFTLDHGRAISNENDQRLLALLCSLATPSFVFPQTTASAVWYVEHPFQTNNVFYRVENLAGKRVYPAEEYVLGNNLVLLFFSAPVDGRCIVFGADSGLTNPALGPIGLPSDSSWDDGPVDLQATDTIVDAFDKINETLAILYPPPNYLSGDMQITFGIGLSYHTSYLSVGNTFVALSAGMSFNKVVTSPSFQFSTPSSPSNQFNKSDQGILNFYKNGVVEDYLDLTTALVSDLGPSLFLQLSARTLLFDLPKYSKGSFIVYGSPSWLTTGENKDLMVEHDLVALYQTNPVTLFYDNGVVPSSLVTPTLTEKLLASSVFLSGIQYYGLGDQFVLTAAISNVFNKTYLASPARVALPGMVTADLAFSSIGVYPTRASSLANYSFTGTLTDYFQDTNSNSTQSGGYLVFNHTLPATPVTFLVKHLSRWVAGSLFTISTTLDFTTVPSSGTHFRSGLRLKGATDGIVDFVLKGLDTIAVYVTLPGSVVEALVDSDTITPVIAGDAIEFEVVDLGGSYEFNYSVNGGGPVTLTTVSDNPQWGPSGSSEVTVSIFATNNLAGSTYPVFTARYDAFVSSAGRAKILDVVPTVTDSLDLTNVTLELDAPDVFSTDAVASVVGLSVRGNGAAGISASENRLVNTWSSGSTALLEVFTDEDYRLPFGAWNTPPASPTGNWTSTAVLGSSDAQVIPGELVYPSIDFTSGYLPVQAGLVNYSTHVGVQHYQRGFRPSAPKNQGTIRVSGLTIADLGVAVDIFVKVPTVTGWKNLAQVFDLSTYVLATDGQGVLLSRSGNDFSFTLGAGSTGLFTSSSKGYLIFWIRYNSVPTTTVTGIECLGWS
jgi:hypothetical protein